MREVDFAQVDLNLLVVLEALLAERHVTKAARRVHLSQPAVSRALGRLRDVFGDELLVRVGPSMRLTPRAEALREPLREVLTAARDLVAPPSFDPARATGVVRFAAPDIVVHMLVPPLLRLLEREAPNLDVEIVEWSSRWHEHLVGGAIDLTFGRAAGREPGIHSRLLIRNHWACVLRRRHPLARRTWSLDTYLAMTHLLIGFTSEGGGQVDAALAALGQKRRVGLRMPYPVLSPLVVAETDLVLTTARWLAEKLAKGADLLVRDPPVPLAPVDIPMVWHDRTHRDPRQRWLRSTLVELATKKKMLPAR